MQVRTQISVGIILLVLISSLGCTKSHHKEDFIGEWEGDRWQELEEGVRFDDSYSNYVFNFYENDSFNETFEYKKWNCGLRFGIPSASKWKVIDDSLVFIDQYKHGKMSRAFKINYLSKDSFSLQATVPTVIQDTIREWNIFLQFHKKY